jgi:hypothetical protein
VDDFERRAEAINTLANYGYIPVGPQSRNLTLGQLEAMASIARNPSAAQPRPAVSFAIRAGVAVSAVSWVVTVVALVLAVGYSHRTASFAWEAVQCGRIHPYGSSAQYQCWERQIRQGAPRFWEVP